MRQIYEDWYWSDGSYTSPYSCQQFCNTLISGGAIQTPPDEALLIYTFSICQSIGSSPCSFRNLLARLNGRLPKKPR